MDDATLTSKSQLTLPKAVREAMGIGPGDRIRFVPSLNGFRIVALKGDVTRLRGMFKGRRAKAVSIDEMHQSVADAAVRRFERSK